MYLVLHAATISWFPFVHSDEAWLASLTREIIARGSLVATEPFFRLTPRYPHAVKSLFHLLQLPFVAASFSHVSVRLLSLTAALATLFLFYRGALRLSVGRGVALVATALLAVDAQFLYVSHLARQEIVLMLVSAAAFFLAFPLSRWSRRTPFYVGTLLGIAIGFHPNAFIVALPFLPMPLLTYDAPRERLSGVVRLGGVLALWALLYVGASYLMDSAFLDHYLAFGRSVGVEDSLIRRFYRFRLFFLKLVYQQAGTYYLPPVRLPLAVFLSTLVISAALAATHTDRRREVATLVLSVLTTLGGYFAVGKYAPPSAAFLWVPCYLLSALVASILLRGRRGAFRRKGLGVVLALLLSVATLWNTGKAVTPWRAHSYGTYVETLREIVPRGEKVLANLNVAFAFPPGDLYVYRDLVALGDDIVDYLQMEGIRYVALPEEMEVIVAQRPQWNMLYGNVYSYYPRLREFLDASALRVGQVHAPVYAMRIVPYMDRADATVSVYRMNEAP